jgi:hypothetical protein
MRDLYLQDKTRPVREDIFPVLNLAGQNISLKYKNQCLSKMFYDTGDILAIQKLTAKPHKAAP